MLVPASRQPPRARLLPHAGPSRPSSCLAAASPGPAPAQPDGVSQPKAPFLNVGPSGPSSCLPLMACAGPPEAARSRPRQAQLLPGVGPWGHGLCPTVAPPGPARASAWPPQAQLLPVGGLSPDPALASRHPLQAQSCFQLLDHFCACLVAASPSPAFAFLQFLEAELHFSNGLFRPSSCVCIVPSGPELSHVIVTRPSFCIWSAF
uniref:cDNA FLJ52613 n=1 Tax=Homo sapiens TaxID=9606 RepID=B7Z6Y9_HUMAN|nr:unnamed protein product [Homo sapiens]